jgi:NAD(P)-dependent dehydrogenase (short-subunit alcohol dehydrogenase family)
VSVTVPVPRSERLAGKVAVVTGASRGIGRAIAVALAREGAAVAGCALAGPQDGGRSGGFLDDLPAAPATGGAAGGGRSFLVACDVRRSDEVARFQQQVERELGVADILVNNAGIVVREALVSLSEQDWNDVIAANLTSVFLVTRAFLPAMLARGQGGRIINIASIAGRQGTAMLTSYCASKHGVVGLTRALAEEVRDGHIRVNAICPGSVDTDMLRIGMPGGVARMTPEDVARTALFLATDAPDALTGACIDVFG